MEYNGTKFTFLDTVGEKFVGMVQKSNQIIGIINNQDTYLSDFTDAVARFKESSWDLDCFCSDETLSFHLFNKDTVEDTPQHREIYYLRLRKHIEALQAKGELK